MSVMRGDNKGDGNANGGADVNYVWREVALCVWFVAVLAAYFLPCLGLNAPDMTALYGLFLLVSVGALVLGLLRGGYGVADVTGDTPASDTILTSMVSTQQPAVQPDSAKPSDAAIANGERKPRRGR